MALLGRLGPRLVVGRYINGDWWVIGPITIASIKPESLRDGVRIRHGSMQNPSPKSTTQGYDNAMFFNGKTGRYDARANAAFNVTRQNPLTLAPSTSLVSTSSHPIAGELPQIESCAVLTCVAHPPPTNAFRPPYCGADKRPRWTADNLDMTMFAHLDPVAGAPTVSELVEQFERTWLDHFPGSTGRYLHPRQNMPDYGRDLAELVGLGALTLQLEIPRGR